MQTAVIDVSINELAISTVKNLAVSPTSLMHKNLLGCTKSVNVHLPGRTSCKIYMVDTSS